MQKLCALATLAAALVCGAPSPAAAQSASANLRDYLDFALSLSYSWYRSVRHAPKATPAAAPAGGTVP